MTDRLVNAETLAAALHDTDSEPWGDVASYVSWATRALAAIPPDPRLDALLAAARQFYAEWYGPMFDQGEFSLAMGDLRDALAAFDD